MENKKTSLNALKTFEAVARNQSFRAAAQELEVTPGAVSQQIKRLEQSLGQKLFERDTRNSCLTPAGDQLYFDAQKSFLRLEESVLRIRNFGIDSTLAVATLPGFAHEWLEPRLANFKSRYPEYNLRIVASNGLIDLNRGGVDIAVRLGLGSWGNIRGKWLFDHGLHPTCRAHFSINDKKLTTAKCLCRYPLLHLKTTDAWRVWFKAHNIDFTEQCEGIILETPAELIEAVVNGEGIALSWNVPQGIIEREGLINPLTIGQQPTRLAYYVVPKNRALPKVKDFCDWIFSQVNYA